MEHRAPAVTRAIHVLRLLGSSREPLGVTAIARSLGLVPSSCLHVLRALAEEGLVRMDPRSKHYSLGLGLLALTRGMLSHNQFAQIVQPELDDIAHRYGVTSTAVELDGTERMVVVAMAQGATPLKIQVSLGSRFPALISATGRCVAAHLEMPKSQLREKFRALKWQSPPKFSDWLEEVRACRRNLVTVDVGNYITGFTVVAAPVIGAGGVHQAISAIGVSEQLSGRTLAQLKKDTRDAAQRVSAQLSGAA